MLEPSNPPPMAIDMPEGTCRGMFEPRVSLEPSTSHRICPRDPSLTKQTNVHPPDTSVPLVFEGEKQPKFGLLAYGASEPFPHSAVDPLIPKPEFNTVGLGTARKPMAAAPFRRTHAHAVHDDSETEVWARRKICVEPSSALPRSPETNLGVEPTLVSEKSSPPRTSASPSKGRYATSPVVEIPQVTSEGPPLLLVPLLPLLLLSPSPEELAPGA